MSYLVETVDLPEQPSAVVRGRVTHQGIAAFLGRAFGEVMAVVAPQGLAPAGPAFGRYRPTDDGGWDIEAGFTLARPLDGAHGDVEPATLPGGLTARTLHVGDYSGVGAAYQALDSWLTEHGYTPSGQPWECYLDGPEVASPRTEVYQPCRTS